MAYMGIELQELRELLAVGHEAVFSWKGKRFILQPEDREMVIYSMEPQTGCLCRIPAQEQRTASWADLSFEQRMGAVDRMLQEKWLDGRSILELLDEIHVDEIF